MINQNSEDFMNYIGSEECRKVQRNYPEELKKHFSTDEARKILEACRTRIVFSAVQDADATLSDRPKFSNKGNEN